MAELCRQSGLILQAMAHVHVTKVHPFRRHGQLAKGGVVFAVAARTASRNPEPLAALLAQVTLSACLLPEISACWVQTSAKVPGSQLLFWTGISSDSSHLRADYTLKLFQAPPRFEIACNVQSGKPAKTKYFSNTTFSDCCEMQRKGRV